MIRFRQYSDEFGERNSAAIEQSDSVYTRNLTANTEAVIDIPNEARFAIFQYDVQRLWTRFDGATLTVPSTNSDDADVSLNPDVRYIANVDSIRLISPTDGIAVVSFYG